MSEIPPCPFCKSRVLDFKRRRYDGEVLFRVKCNGCGSMSGEYSDLNAAISAWSRRG